MLFKKVHKISIVVLVSLIYTNKALCIEQQSLYRSAEFLGRGDTGISIADNQEAIFYNPAGTAYGKGIYKRILVATPMIELSADTKDLIRKVFVEKKTTPQTFLDHIGKNQHLGIYNLSAIVLRRAAIAGFASTREDLLVYKSPSDNDRGLEKIRAESTINQGIAFNISEQLFFKDLYLGTTIKYIDQKYAVKEASMVDASGIQESLSESELLKKGTANAVDFGVMYRGSGKSRFSLGINIKNIGNPTFSAASGSSAPAALKQVVNIGFGWNLGTKFSKVRLLLDVQDTSSALETNIYKKIHLGADIAFKKFMGLAFGFNQGYVCFGYYFNAYIFRIDLGSYAEEISKWSGTRPDSRYFMRIAAGF